MKYSPEAFLKMNQEKQTDKEMIRITPSNFIEVGQAEEDELLIFKWEVEHGGVQ